MSKEVIKIDKRLYEKLLDKDKESELIFKNMLNGFALHEMIYNKDGKAVDYIFLSANPSFSIVTGIDNPIGKKVKDIFPDLDLSWIELYEDILTSGKPARVQKYQKETSRWYDIVGFKVREKEFAVFFTDITQFKKAEQKIEKSLKLNNILLDAIPHPAMLVDKNRIILAANEKSRDMGAVVGSNCYDGFSTCKTICQNQENCCFCNRGLDLNSMDSKNLEIEAYEGIWNVWWVPVGNNAFLHYSIDITDIRRGEQNLIESARELKTSNKELEQFAYVASHDLQEPLRVVSTYCQLIEMFVNSNCKDNLNDNQVEELDKYINFTTDATNRMRFLIKDLLEFSRVGRLSDNYVMIDINEVVNNVIKDFDIAIKEYDVVIENVDMPTIMGKKRRIGQIFHNIISNAIKFRNKKRDIIIFIDVEERKNDYLFSISDTGIGIEKKQLDRIFGIFKRLHTREEYPGTGIGLALVKKIVENHGGEIWVESEKDIGSTFFFTIPKSWEIIKIRK